MNERIKELAKEAGAHISTRNLMSNPPQHVETVELWDDRIEKFAELIIEECGRVADVFCHIWCEEDKPHDVTVSNYIKRHVLRADPE